MALDPNIILGGRGVDVMGAMGAGNALATQTNQLQQQNALAQLYKTQGAGIMNGDPNALNALAAIDPAAGQGFQAGALGMDQTRQQMAVLDENTKRAAEEYARGLSAEQKAAEAAQIEAGVKQALMAPTPEAFDAMMIQMGHPDMVGQFENRETLAAQFMSVAEIMKTIQPPATDPLKGAPDGYMFKDPNNPAAGVVPIPGMPATGPEWRAATPEEAAAYGAAAGQINAKTGEFKKSSADNGITQTIRNPDGTETTIQIGGAGIGQGGSTSGDALRTSMTDASSVVSLIDEIAKDPALPGVTGAIEGGGGNNVDEFGVGRRMYYGDAGLSVIQKIAQLQGNAWLGARALLKGGGAITDYESKKAEGAMARLSRAQGDKEFQAALKDLRDAITEGMAKLNGAPGSGSPPPATGFDQAEIDQLMNGP